MKTKTWFATNLVIFTIVSICLSGPSISSDYKTARYYAEGDTNTVPINTNHTIFKDFSKAARINMCYEPLVEYFDDYNKISQEACGCIDVCDDVADHNSPFLSGKCQQLAEACKKNRQEIIKGLLDQKGINLGQDLLIQNHSQNIEELTSAVLVNLDLILSKKAAKAAKINMCYEPIVEFLDSHKISQEACECIDVCDDIAALYYIGELENNMSPLFECRSLYTACHNYNYYMYR